MSGQQCRRAWSWHWSLGIPGDAHRPAVVEEGLEPQIPVAGVDDLVEHQVRRPFGCRAGAFHHERDELAELHPKQRRVIESQPPDPAGRQPALPDQVTHRLVERRRLPDASRTQDQVEAARRVAEQPLPEQASEGALRRVRERCRDRAGAVPRVLRPEHLQQCLGRDRHGNSSAAKVSLCLSLRILTYT